MARKVKNVRSVARTRISSKHQVTITKPAFDEAGLQAGDVVAIRATGPGRVELTNLDGLFARHRARLTGAAGRLRALDEQRGEWD